MTDITYDKLDQLFNLQNDLLLQLKLDEKTLNGIAHLKEMILALHTELSELLQEFNWKSWKKSKKHIDIDKINEELIDCWHFLMNITIYIGLDSEQLRQKFIGKHYKNKKRIEDEY